MKAPVMVMNHRHRQYLQHLRGGHWVKVTRLPESKRLVAIMHEKGWIEAQGSGRELAYRITAAGLAAMKIPVRLYDGINKQG